MKKCHVWRTILLATGIALAGALSGWSQDAPRASGQVQEPGSNPGADGETTPADKPAEAEAAAESPIAVGDILLIQVKEDGRLLNNQYRVGTKGMISFSYVGDIAVEGLTSTEAADKLKRKLEEDYLQQANVTVEVGRPMEVARPGGGRQVVTDMMAQMSMGTVYVMGKVRRPGPVEMTKDFTVSKAIVAAGGHADFAKLSQTKLVRKKPDGKSEEIIVNVLKIIREGKLELDVPVQKDDWIIVPDAIFPGPS